MTRSHEHPVKKAAAAGGKRIATRMRTMSDDLTIVAVATAGGDDGSVGCSMCVLYAVYGEESCGLPLCGWMVVYSILNNGSVVVGAGCASGGGAAKVECERKAGRRAKLSGQWSWGGERESQVGRRDCNGIHTLQVGKGHSWVHSETRRLDSTSTHTDLQ